MFGTLNTTIDTIFSPELRKMIGKKRRVDFEEMAERKTVLFVSNSAVSPALHCFINMFYAQAFKTLFEYAEGLPDGRLPIPVHVLCDDFATGSRILNFPEYISIFREKQISVTLMLQSESQLESMSYQIVMRLWEKGIKTLSACSERIVEEKDGNKMSTFVFRGFREY